MRSTDVVIVRGGMEYSNCGSKGEGMRGWGTI